jgi:hypothetical protein
MPYVISTRKGGTPPPTPAVIEQSGVHSTAGETYPVTVTVAGDIGGTAYGMGAQNVPVSPGNNVFSAQGLTVIRVVWAEPSAIVEGTSFLFSVGSEIRDDNGSAVWVSHVPQAGGTGEMYDLPEYPAAVPSDADIFAFMIPVVQAKIQKNGYNVQYMLSPQQYGTAGSRTINMRTTLITGAGIDGTTGDHYDWTLTVQDRDYSSDLVSTYGSPDQFYFSSTSDDATVNPDWQSYSRLCAVGKLRFAFDVTLTNNNGFYWVEMLVEVNDVTGVTFSETRVVPAGSTEIVSFNDILAQEFDGTYVPFLSGGAEIKITVSSAEDPDSISLSADVEYRAAVEAP